MSAQICSFNSITHWPKQKPVCVCVFFLYRGLSFIWGVTEYELWIRLILRLRLWPFTAPSFYFLCKTHSERSSRRRSRSVPESRVPASCARVCVRTSFLWCASASSDVLIEGCCCLKRWGGGKRRREGQAPKKEVTSIFMALDMHMLSTFNMWRQGKVF